jgi:hypothetical protein
MITIDPDTRDFLRFIIVIAVIVFMIATDKLSNDAALGVLVGVFFPNTWSQNVVKKKINEVIGQ